MLQLQLYHIQKAFEEKKNNKAENFFVYLNFILILRYNYLSFFVKAEISLHFSFYALISNLLDLDITWE
jgi:hypothetical protein